MELGVNLGYFGMGVDGDNVAVAKEADRLGYAVAWAAEAYGSDVPTVLAWIGAQTERIGLGAAVMQIPGRTPAMTAMTAATLDTLSGGRFRLGLGVSGPQVSEGWHGVRFDAPLGRTREYVDIVRMALRRETVSYQGKHFTLPLPDGPGKALKLTVHPPRPHIPLYLAAVGPKNLELAGEVADGWHAIFFSPEHSGDLVESVRTGRRRAGHGADGTDPLTGFDIAPSVPVVIADDVEAAADAIRPYAALYVGGMGSREQNFYNRLACRMGFEEAAAQVQDLYLAKQHRDAAAAVPFEFIDATTLIGPPDRIRDRLQRYADAGVGTLSVAPFAGALEDRLRVVRTMAELMGETGSAVPAPHESRPVTLSFLQAIILGIVEGLTEFLPVSSTGHLTITEKLLGLQVDAPAITAYTAIIQLGAILATLIFFWRDIVRLLVAWVRGLGSAEARTDHDYQLAWAVIVGSIPVGIVGFLAKDLISGPLRSLWVVAAALILWSVVMWLAESRHGKLEREGVERTEGGVTLMDGLVIGLVQCFALIPGVSRSGATISAGLFRGIDRVSATRLSFFMAIPALTAAGLFEAVQEKDHLKLLGGAQMAVGIVVAFVVAYASIAWLLRFVSSNKITAFVWYRVPLGIVLAVLLATGVMSAT